MITPITSFSRFSAYPGSQRAAVSPVTQPLSLATQAVSFGKIDGFTTFILSCAGFASAAFYFNNRTCNEQFQAEVAAAPAALHSGNPAFIASTEAQIAIAAGRCASLTDASRRAAHKNGVQVIEVDDQLDRLEDGKLKATIGSTPTSKP